MTDMLLSAIHPDPDQPRKRFAQAALDELAASIRSVGLLEPIIVRPGTDPGQWCLVAGERRWRACQAAGLERIPVIVRDIDAASAFEVQMIENVIRSDMDPMEEAEGYGRLLAAGLTIESVSERLGKSTSAIRSRLKLLKLSPIVADLVAKGHLDAWSAAHLARLSHEGQAKVLRAMTEGRLPKLPRM